MRKETLRESMNFLITPIFSELLDERIEKSN